MIITFWMYVYCLLDTPEYRTRLEARRIASAIEHYRNTNPHVNQRNLRNFIGLSSTT